MTEDRYLGFSLGEEEYAIPLLDVKEVIAIPEITPIPQTPPHFLGMMNLRGQVISVIDLRKKLSITPKEGTETAIIICDLESVILGIVVDSVNSVISPAQGEVSPKPTIESRVKSEYITGVFRRDDRLILFLNISGALDTADLSAASRTKAA